MATPYIAGTTIQYPEGTDLADVNVTCRIESTNESFSKITDSEGVANFNFGNNKEFPSGWHIGDIFTIVVLYQGFEAYTSHTIVSGEGGFNQTIVLEAVPIAPSLHIITPKEIIDYFNLKIIEDDAENGVSMQQLVKIGVGVEKAIEDETNNVFDNNGGSNYSETKHLDTDKFEQVYYTDKIPVVSVTALYTTQGDSETYPDYPNNTSGWTSLTEGTDFVIDLDTGRIQITNSSYAPISSRWGLYYDILYGRSSAPEDIKTLVILEIGLQLSAAKFIRDKIKKITEVEIGDIESFMNYRKRIVMKYMHQGIGNTNT